MWIVSLINENITYKLKNTKDYWKITWKFLEIHKKCMKILRNQKSIAWKNWVKTLRY